MPVVVEQVVAAVTFPLRQRVLRPHQRIAAMAWPGDDAPRAAHFAAYDEDDRVVGIASVQPAPAHWRPARTDGWRLRGMATDPEQRGTGVGRAVLDRAEEHVARAGGGLLWCHARVPAQGFYERAGFVTRGEPWEEPDIGPHVVMWREVTAR